MYEEIEHLDPPGHDVEDGPDVGYILMGFQFLERSLAATLEHTWRDWSGARYGNGRHRLAVGRCWADGEVALEPSVLVSGHQVHLPEPGRLFRHEAHLAVPARAAALFGTV